MNSLFHNQNLLCIFVYTIGKMGKRGRNKDLVSLRDEALLRRYYYWTEIQRLRFDDALKILSLQEFFISEERIMNIIRQNCHKLDGLQITPVPKVRMPRLTAAQLKLFTDEPSPKP